MGWDGGVFCWRLAGRGADCVGLGSGVAGLAVYGFGGGCGGVGGWEVAHGELGLGVERRIDLGEWDGERVEQKGK